MPSSTVLRTAAAVVLSITFSGCAAQPAKIAPAETGAAGQVTIGAARFTVVTPQCIRLEYQADGKFIDSPSYFASSRPSVERPLDVKRDGQSTVIDTGAIHLVYTPDGHPFSGENLQAKIQQGGKTIDWHAGLPNENNLGGTERTLDGWSTARQLSDGLLSRNGWYVLDDSKGPLIANGQPKDRPADAGTDWYLFGYGSDYKAALRSLTAVSGAVPLPRRNMLGAWYSRYWPYTDSEFRQIVQEYTEHQFPLDVLVLDMDWHTDGWTGYTWNKKLLPDPKALIDWVHSQGLAITLNDHPADGVQKKEDCYADFMRAMGKDPQKDKPIPFDAGDPHYLDTFYAYTHTPLIKQGVDFWWLDWQQFPNTRSVPSLTNLAWLNQYYFEKTGEDGRRGASLSRWAGWGDQRHPIHFSGDAHTDFSMLAAEVPFTSTAGNVGCFFWSHDIGGHMGGRNEESYARWCQFGAFSAALRSHSTRSKTMDRRPWTYEKWAEDSMRVSFQLRSEFFPYLYTAAAEACEQSVPMIRPMYFDSPTVDAAYNQPQQYLLGENLLVAPVTEAGAGPNRLGRQTVWFPQGTWFNYFTNERFTGDQQILTACSIDEFPLYVRAGVPIAMRPYTPRMTTDPLTNLVVRCYPGADGQTGSSILYEDDGITTQYEQGQLATTRLSYARRGNRHTVTIAATDGRYANQPESRSIEIVMPGLQKASQAQIDGTPVAIDYDAASSTNRIRVPNGSIRKQITVDVWADEMDPHDARIKAFARRAGLPQVDANASMTNLLSASLSQTNDENLKQALAAAAGVGVFGRNLNVYGWPTETTPQAFAAQDIPAAVQQTVLPDNGLNAKKMLAADINLDGKPVRLSTFPTKEFIDLARRPGNIAPSAAVTVSSGGPGNGLIDGNASGYPDSQDFEWASRHEKGGAWAQLKWTSPQTIDRVILFDRPNLNDWVKGGTIEFSDGTSQPFGVLQNDGLTGLEIAFAPKNVAWIKVKLDKVGDRTANAGLSEIEVLTAK